MPKTPRRLRLSELPRDRDTAFEIVPDAEARRRIAQELGIVAVRKLRLAGLLSPVDRQDWDLAADLGATAVQTCVATLAPVTTRIDEPVARSYSATVAVPPEGEIETPEDDTEPLPETLDLEELAREALALALPVFPRAADAEPVAVAVAAPGTRAMTDEDARPFSGLKDLRNRLGKGEG